MHWFLLLQLNLLPKWSYCDTHYIVDLLLRVVYDILWKLCSDIRVCLIAVIIEGLQWPIEVSCECVHGLCLHVSPSDVACMELLSLVNWNSCPREASRNIFHLGITDLWAVFCRFVWCSVFWCSIRESWCHAVRSFACGWSDSICCPGAKTKAY